MAVQSWLSTSCTRWYPASEPGARRTLSLDAARNEQFSFQVVVRSDDANTQKVQVAAEGPSGWAVRVRRVGYVPVRHLNTALAEGPLEVEGLGHVPGYVPDPLFDEAEVVLPRGECHAFWITVRPGAEAVAGAHRISVRISPERDKARTHTVKTVLHDIALQPRRDFAITHWFYADSIAEWYRVTPFGESFWPLCEAYLRDYAAHGLDMIYVPVFTPPLDGVKRPTQLLRVTDLGEGKYGFDWTDVRRWVGMAKACGIREFEWTHPFTQWGVRHAIRIYEGQGLDEKLLWPPETPATGAGVPQLPRPVPAGTEAVPGGGGLARPAPSSTSPTNPTPRRTRPTTGPPAPC